MAAPKIVEGQTATNPTTGAKIVYSKGRWYPAGAHGAAPGGVPTKLTPQEQIDLREARQAAENASAEMRQAARFRSFNAAQESGGLMAIPKVPEIMSAFDPEVAGMETVTAQMTPAQRQPGAGTTSDRDLSLYGKAVPSIARPRQANDTLIDTRAVEGHRRQAHSAWLERWAQEKGNLLGAQDAFEKWWGEQMAKPAAPAAVSPAKPHHDLTDEELKAEFGN